jgi:transposase-like protein
MTETNISRVHCPKCGAVAVKNGFKSTRKGRKQRWLCNSGHTFHTLHLPEDLR